jgi:hypothetical protein
MMPGMTSQAPSSAGSGASAPARINRKLLSIYLNDHLAGSTLGVELARRTAGANQGTEFGPEMERLATEIEEDREALKDILQTLGIRADPLKVPLGWTAEKIGRLKLNGQVTGYSPLSRLVEVEGLTTGVTGKLSLWRCLRDVATVDGRLDDKRLAGLASRAEAQLETLDGLRRRAATLAFLG